MPRIIYRVEHRGSVRWQHGSIFNEAKGEIVTSYEARLIGNHPELDLRLCGEHGTDNQLYGNVIRVRAHGGGDVTFPFDEYSEHYCLYHQSNPVGTLTTTRNVCGDIDCKEFCPSSLLSVFRQELASSCKFRINSSSCPHRLAAMRWMARMIWGDLLQLGVRLDLINAKRDMIRFYERMGYSAIEGSGFVHPLLGTESRLLFISADPSLPSYFQDVFARAPGALSKPRVLEVIQQLTEEKRL